MIEEVLTIIRTLPPLKERHPKFHRPPGCVDSYSWFINEWMPSQPDFDKLANLTILLNFHMGLVVAALMGEQKFLDEFKTFHDARLKLTTADLSDEAYGSGDRVGADDGKTKE